jgi:hypothetical protein
MQLSSQIKHQSSQSDRLSIFFLGNSLAAAFPFLGSGYTLQLLNPFLSQRFFRGFRFYPYCRVEIKIKVRFLKKKRQQKMLSLIRSIPENKSLI